MDFKDILLTPVYLIIIYSLAFYFRPKVTNLNTKKYFIPALSLKLFGAIALGLIYQFYYKGGDTFNYYKQSKVIFNAFIDSPIIGLKLLFASGDLEGDIIAFTSRIFWYRSPSEYFIIKLSALFGLIGFQTYTVISLFFAVVSFVGLWALYLTFLKIYPSQSKDFAISIFFIPSVFFWGSGLLKDTICIGALGWMFYGFYNIFIIKKKIIKSTLILIISILIIKTIKIYILLSFIPPALFWIFIENSKRISNPLIKVLAAPVLIGVGLFAAYYGATNITAGDKVYAIENLAERTKINAEYLYSISVRDQGSAYNLGEMDGTLSGMIKLGPQAIFVTLFRPFLWEAKNPVMLLSALEATFFILFTIYLFAKIGLFKVVKIVLSTPLLIFCFLFSLIFAFGVGINSYNFGTLVRYKIPLLPFFLSALYILKFYYENERIKKRSFLFLPK